jgi:hypothetical protein
MILGISRGRLWYEFGGAGPNPTEMHPYVRGGPGLRMEAAQTRFKAGAAAGSEAVR